MLPGVATRQDAQHKGGPVANISKVERHFVSCNQHHLQVFSEAQDLTPPPLCRGKPALPDAQSSSDTEGSFCVTATHKPNPQARARSTHSAFLAGEFITPLPILQRALFVSLLMVKGSFLFAINGDLKLTGQRNIA